MSDIVLRPARSTDAGKVGAILSAFIDETDWMPRVHTRAQDVGFAGYMIDQDWVVVAMRDGIVAGFLACDDTAVQALYVASDVRGSGIGSALLQHAQSRRTALTLWTFQANVMAQEFYLNRGFAEIERTDGAGNDEKLPDIRLEWTGKGN